MSNNEKQRPTLTRLCEPILLRLLPSAGDKDTGPLPALPNRLLIVKVFGMGDAILVRSIIEYLSSRHPQMQFGVLVGPATRELLSSIGPFQVHEYAPDALTPGSALRILMSIRNCHYDAILNCEQRSLVGSAFLAATGIKYRLGFLPLGDTPKGRFLTHSVRFQDHQSVWQSFLRLARLVDIEVPDTLLPTPIHWDIEAERWACDWWDMYVGLKDIRAVALHVGSQGREFSRWPLHRFVELAEYIRSRVGELVVILTGTQPERYLIREFISGYSGRASDACESGSVARTAALLKRCDLLVSNDTGIMHLGAALGTPTVGLFGPNSPRYWAPLGPRATYVYDTKVPCSPCLNLYADRWPLECTHSVKGRCMLDITVESVMRAAKSVVVGDWLN